MKGLLAFLGLGGEREEPSSSGDTTTVRRIIGELDHLERSRARYLAAFAFTLSRVAHADLDISDDEISAMEGLVAEHGDLPEAQAVLVVEIARHQAELFGGTENFQVVRQLRDLADVESRTKILDCLFAVAAADGSISGDEESQIRLIADELNLSRRIFVDVRRRWNEARSVIQSLGRQPAGDA